MFNPRPMTRFNRRNGLSDLYFDCSFQVGIVGPYPAKGFENCKKVSAFRDVRYLIEEGDKREIDACV